MPPRKMTTKRKGAKPKARRKTKSKGISAMRAVRRAA